MRTKAEKEHFAQTIIEASEILARIGWSIAIPQTNEVDHLVVGTKEALGNVLSTLPAEYEVMTKEEN